MKPEKFFLNIGKDKWYLTPLNIIPNTLAQNFVLSGPGIHCKITSANAMAIARHTRDAIDTPGSALADWSEWKFAKESTLVNNLS